MHVISEVVLPSETVIDIAIDNGFTSLTAAVVQEDLLSTLTNPHGQFTVFAPTDSAFDNLAVALGTNLIGVLAHPDLTNILLYHVLDSKVLSTDLTNGTVITLNGQNITVDLSMGVMINDANVTSADILSDNGVVHILDRVLLPTATSSESMDSPIVTVYPNPALDFINVSNFEGTYKILNMNGKLISKGGINNNPISLSSLSVGNYILNVANNKSNFSYNFIKK